MAEPTDEQLADAAFERYARAAMETTGPLVQMLVRWCVEPEATERLAVEYAKQGLRAARLLGIYRDDA